MKTTLMYRLLAIAVISAASPALAFSAEYYVNFYLTGGFYLWAREGGGGPPYGLGVPRGEVRASMTYPPNRFADWILTDVNGGSLESGDQVYIRTGANGQLMCAENGGGGRVNANRVSVGGYELFTIHKVSGGGTIGHNDQIALQASSGHFLCAENGGGLGVVADRLGIGAWETFQLQIRWLGPPYWTVADWDPWTWNDWEIDPEFPYYQWTVQYNNNCYN